MVLEYLAGMQNLLLEKRLNLNSFYIGSFELFFENMYLCTAALLVRYVIIYYLYGNKVSFPRKIS
jgi:hypothetical protein